MPTTGRPRSCRPISPGAAPTSPDPDHPQPRLSGPVPRESLRRIGAPETSFQIDGLEFYDKLSFLKGGIVYASHLTTVSATYAREITTPEQGCGLEGLLRSRSNAALTGILNGIDESWDPRSAPSSRNPSAPATGASRPTPITSASNSGWRCRAARFSGWSPGWCTRRASTRAVGRRRDHRGRRADHRHRQRRARRSSRRWSTRSAAGPTRSASRSASTTRRRGGSLPAAISR